MPIEQYIDGEAAVQVQRFTDAKLNLTSARWALGEGEASVVLGLDVTRRGVFQPERGRRTVGVFKPSGADAVSAVYPCSLSGAIAAQYRDIIRIQGTVTGASYVSSAATYDSSVPNITLAGAFTNYVFNEGDEAVAFQLISNNKIPLGRVKVKSRTSDDAIVLERPFPVHQSTSIYGWVERVARNDMGRGYGYVTTENGNITLLVKTKNEYAISGPWPSDMKGGVVLINEDGRIANAGYGTVDAVATSFEESDTLRLAITGVTPTDTYKLAVIYEKQADIGGAWLTDGRKFWLVSSGESTLWLDLGTDDYLGQSWSIVQARPGTFLLFNPNTYPRAINMAYGDPVPAISAFAGCLPLHWLPELSGKKSSANDIRPVTMALKTSYGTGMLVAGQYRIKVRPVNVIDGLEGPMLDVASGADAQVFYLAPANTTDGFVLKTWDFNLRGSVFGLSLFSGRWTHIELWRTIGNGATYFLETRIAVHGRRNEQDDDSPELWRILSGSSTLCVNTPSLSDVDLQALSIMSVDDLLFGWPPPICQDAVNVGGVTYCAGKGNRSGRTVTIKVPMGVAQNVTVTPNSVSSKETQFHFENSEGSNYVWKDGDRIVVIDGGRDTATGETLQLGSYLINNRVASGNDLYSWEVPLTSVTIENVRAYIETQIDVDWPVIGSDDQIWYSRTSKFAPESFSKSRFVDLGRTGDIFRRIVAVGNYACVIMDGGVHLLYPGFGGDGQLTILKDTVAQFGKGTLWPKSVIVIGNTAFWANKGGAQVMRVSSSPNETGNLGTIDTLSDESTQTWFQDAAENGWEVDAGLDQYNGALRFRRKKSEHEYEVLQYGFDTERWTTIDDDNGLAYVSASSLETNRKNAPRLYSVTDGAAFMEVNREDRNEDFPGVTLEAVTDSEWEVRVNRIIKKDAFSAALVGHVVRLTSADDLFSDVPRIITEATDDYIQFSAVDDLRMGDSFVIAASRFRVRFAAVRGQGPDHAKTIHAVTIRAHEGEKHKAGSGWENDDPKPMTVRSYSDFASDPTDERADEVPVIPRGAGEQTDIDVSSGVQCDGRAIELEIENLSARTDFQIEDVTLRFREEGLALQAQQPEN